MKEFKDPTRRKTSYPMQIKGGSPDMVIELDPCNFTDGMSWFKKMKRGTIIQRLKVKLRYFESFSEEGKFNICMLPSTCIINKKMIHFLSGYRNYLAKKLCKELTDNAGFSLPTGNHVIKTFPFIVDNPDVCEKFLLEWHQNVSKKIPKTSKKNLDILTTKAEAYISRIYLVRYSDSFGVEEGKEFESAAGDEVKLKAREDLIKYSLNTGKPFLSIPY
jgi:hypothetical protein